jgi:hypothetical protein
VYCLLLLKHTLCALFLTFNIVKKYENTQPNMNSIIKLAAKTAEDLSQLNGKNDAKQDEIQHTRAKLGEVLEKN